VIRRELPRTICAGWSIDLPHNAVEDSTIVFSSPDVTTGVLDIKIQTASVDTGSGMKDGKLKSKDFFHVEHDPFITFHSTKLTQTGPASIEIDGDFTIRGVGKLEKLLLTFTGKGRARAKLPGSRRSTARITA
jgi:polyisoprenoid-binding protein YceI